MNCREALELLGESLAEGPDSLIGWRLKLHLWVCRHCRRYFSSYRTTLRLERAAFADPLEESPAVPDELVREIIAQVRKPHTSSRG